MQEEVGRIGEKEEENHKLIEEIEQKGTPIKILENYPRFLKKV